jgi:hypothetical protein
MDMEHGGDKYPAFPPDVLWVEIITFSWYILCCIHEQTFRDMKPAISPVEDCVKVLKT